MPEITRTDVVAMPLADLRSIADDLTELSGPGEIVHGLLDEIERLRLENEKLRQPLPIADFIESDIEAELYQRRRQLLAAEIEIKALNRVAEAAKVLSMKWMMPGMKIDGEKFLGAVNDTHEAICRLYGIDPKVGFRF